MEVTMSEYLSITEYGQKYKLDRAAINRYIKQGRIPAHKIGSQWVIRADTPRPEDRRVKSGQYRNWRKGKSNNKDAQESNPEDL
jgi:hypothetical protein